MKNIKLILSIIVALSLASCGDFLEKGPTTSQSTEVTLSNYAGLNKAAYAAIMPMYSWYSSSYVQHVEMRSGNGRREASGTFQSGRFYSEYIMRPSILKDATPHSISSGMCSIMHISLDDIINVPTFSCCSIGKRSSGRFSSTSA